MKHEEKKSKTLESVVIESSSTEVVQRYGSAVKEYSVAYSGIDNETGKVLKKSLSSISKEKINPEYKDVNIKQQAGFSAEVLDVADTNADNVIRGNSTRKVRTDDLNSTIDPRSGKTIGGTNDELFDHVELDSKGNIIPGSAAQMKFVGKNPDMCFEKLMSNRYQKYHDADAKIEVPSDYYDGVLEAADRRIEKLQRELKSEKVQNNSEIQKSIEDQIKKCKKIKQNLRKSTVSNEEAVLARMHPALITGKRVVKIAHRAGVKQAGYGALITGSLSLTKNIVSVVNGDLTPEEAAKAVAKDMGTGAVSGYLTAFSGATIKGLMQNSSSIYIRTLSKTNIAATLVSSVSATTKTLEKYIKGKITGLECLEELGETGTTQVASVMFGVVGQMLIPIPIVGSMIGSMIGYVFASSCYNVVVSSLNEAKVAREERSRIEKECAEIIKMICEYKMQLQTLISEYLTENIKIFNDGFLQMEKSIGIDDIDGFIAGNVSIQRQLGYKNQFFSFEEFDTLMNNSKESFKL